MEGLICLMQAILFQFHSDPTGETAHSQGKSANPPPLSRLSAMRLTLSLFLSTLCALSTLQGDTSDLFQTLLKL
jgi:hypothetical protein